MNSRASMAIVACILLGLTISITGCSSLGIGGSESTNDSSTTASPRPSTSGQSASGAAGFSDSMVGPLGLDAGWPYRHPGKIQQSFTANGNVYLVTSSASHDHVLLKVDGESGLPTWTYPLQVPLQHAPSVFVYPEESRRENPDELFIVERGTIHCIDDQYGAINYKIRCNFPIATSVAPGADQLVVGGYDMRVYGLSKKDKFVAWTYLTGGAVTATPITSAGRVYAGSEDGSVYCMKESGGYVQGDSWSFKTLAAVSDSAIADGNRIYLGSTDTKIYCLGDSGDEAFDHWQASVGFPVSDSLSIHGSSLYGILLDERSDDGPRQQVVCLDTADGRERWRQDGYGEVMLTFSDQLWVRGQDGSTSGLSSRDGSSVWTLDTAGALGVHALDDRSMVVVNASGLVQKISKRR